MRHVVIAATVAASLAASGLLLHAAWGRSPKADAKSSHGTGSSKTLDAMEKDLASLKSTVARLQDRSAPPSVDPPADNTEEGPSTEPPVTGAESPPAAPDARAFVSAYNAHVVAEAVDPTWHHEAETAAAEAFQGEAMRGSTLVRADCRSTMCRMDVAHEGNEALERFMNVVPSTAPFDHAGVAYAIQGEEGHPRTVVFIAREGHDLPNVDAKQALTALE